MVLAFYGVQASEEELSRLLGKTRTGTPVLNIELLEQVGSGVRVESGVFDVEQLKQFLDEGSPVIVAVMTAALPYWNADRPHTVVVVGYDEQAVHLNDPKYPAAPQTVRWDEFLAAWEGFEGFGAVVRKQP
jgi:ABC-type bacteriocin/lantibiotic exporter with double-glycine peptidase domain